MLTVNQITKSYGTETILDKVTFTINAGERLGLIGPNGCGKTTLLRILAGMEKADAGSFQLNPPDLKIGYLPQGYSPSFEDTIANYLDHFTGEPDQLNSKLEALAVDLADHPENKQVQGEYDSTLAALQAALDSQHLLPAVLASLGLDSFDRTTPVSHLSGGQKTRLALAGVLLSRPRLFLLDEPTNHLDIEMLEWLEDWLANSPMTRSSAALIVSHDRLFLDNMVSGILELNPAAHQIRSYPGNYTSYLEQKLKELERTWRSYTDQQEEISRLKHAARSVRKQSSFKKGGKGDSGDKFARGFFANRTKEHIARAKFLERRIETLLTTEKIEKPRQDWEMKLEFNRVSESSRQVLLTEDLAVGYPGHPLLENLNLTIHFGQRLVLIGSNGSGKTTLMKTLAGQLPPLAGKIRLGSSIHLGTMSQEQDEVVNESNALEAIRKQAPFSDTAARAFLHQFLFSGDDVFIPASKLSYGERARLLLAQLVAKGCNLLLLDEPINHLDIPSRSRFEKALAEFRGTVLTVVHDRYFIHKIADTIWEVKGNGIRIHPL